MKRLLCLFVCVHFLLPGIAQEVERRIHEVQRGESLDYIAAKYNVSVDEIQNHNQFLDKYFYVGQKLNVPIKIKPKVERSYSESSSYRERTMTKKKRTNGGWEYTPSMYASPFPMSGGFGNPLLDPGYALMQTQQQMSLAQQSLQERWRIEQQSQQFFQNQNNAWQTMPASGAWNSVPIMVETPAYVPSEPIGGKYGSENKINSSSKTSSSSPCYLCHGIGKCWTCNGNRTYLNPLTGKYIDCPNCTDGLCSHCHGSGKK